MPAALDYDETVRLLRASLSEAEANAWAFQVHSRARPALVSSRTWNELAQIEAVLAHHIEEALKRELRVEPRTVLTRVRKRWRQLSRGVAREHTLVARMLRESCRSPVSTWREQTPQLEGSLWSFFVARTQYFANTFSLALNEPTPFPPLVWYPSRRTFQGQ